LCDSPLTGFRCSHPPTEQRFSRRQQLFKDKKRRSAVAVAENHAMVHIIRKYITVSQKADLEFAHKFVICQQPIFIFLGRHRLYMHCKNLHQDKANVQRRLTRFMHTTAKSLQYLVKSLITTFTSIFFWKSNSVIILSTY